MCVMMRSMSSNSGSIVTTETGFPSATVIVSCQREEKPTITSNPEIHSKLT